MSKTYGDQFKEAMACKTVEEAATWMQTEIKRYHDEFQIEADQARKTIMVNIGYMAGYYDDAHAQHIAKMFGAVHPIFGSSDYHQTVTPEQAFEMGVKAATK